MPRVTTTTQGQTNLDVPVSSRAAILDYTAARAALLPNLDALVSSRAARQTAATVFTNTENLAGGVGTVLIDSGALAAGEYQIIARAADSSDGGSRAGAIFLQYRNAANSANNWQQILVGFVNHLAGGDTSPSGQVWIPRLTVAVNERFRLVSAAAMSDANSQSLWIALV